MALCESLLAQHEEEIQIFVSCADADTFAAIESLRVPQIIASRDEPIPKRAKWLPSTAFAFAPLERDAPVVPLSRVTRALPSCVAFTHLRMITPALIVVDEHEDTRFGTDALVRCVMPYVEALTRASAWVKAVLRDETAGMYPEALRPGHTFLADASLREALARRGLPHVVVPIDEVWTCYATDQLVTRPEPIATAASAPPPVPHAVFEGDEHVTPAPKVSALVSTYAAEEFIAGCLEDLVGQTLFARGELEVVVVDSHSPTGEGAIVRDFMKRHPGRIRYLRTPQREGVYMAWNRAARAARGRYLTNANTDDRHRSDAFEKLATALDDHANVGLVYGRSLVTADPGASFDEAHIRGRFAWPAFERARLLHGCFIGPHPMWRKRVHGEVGWFDQRYRVAGDFEMWMRIVERFDARLVPEELGLYLYRGESVENANREVCAYESVAARQLYASRGNVTLTPGRYPSTYFETFAATAPRPRPQPVLAAG